MLNVELRAELIDLIPVLFLIGPHSAFTDPHLVITKNLLNCPWKWSSSEVNELFPHNIEEIQQPISDSGVFLHQLFEAAE